MRQINANGTQVAFSANALIFRGPIQRIQAQSHFATETRNIPELGIWGGAFTDSSAKEAFDFGTVRLNGRWSTVGLSLLSGLRDSSLDTVAQDFAFKLGENGQHTRKRSAAWRG